MGAGKSVVGKNLATFLKREYISTDDLIETKERKRITEIFKISGEPYFRSVERNMVAEVSVRENLVIDCGGGVALNSMNINNLKKNGIVFYLSATPEVIYTRVKDQKHRPLLNVDHPKLKIKELLEQRKAFYEKADHTIDTSAKTPNAVAQEILDLYSTHERT